MELRERYALVQNGENNFLDNQTGKVYNTNLMPPDIRREYEKDNCRPRRRGVIAQVIWVILLTPITLLGQWILYLIYFRNRKTEVGKVICPPADWQNRLARAGFILGTFYRLCLIPMIFTMCIAFFVIHAGDPLTEKELSLMYLTLFILLFITGPGKYSVDGMIRKIYLRG